METTTPWYTRPIFISSTFKDMQAERDHLRDVVFPELERRLRERNGHLEPIDLRWGVETVTTAEQEQKELLVLKVCLQEIERSRPFLLVLLGDRYGWVPPERRMRAAVQEKGYQTEVADKSVTALEIEYGVLQSAGQRDRSFFYFREGLPYGEMPPATAAFYSDRYNPEPGAQARYTRLQDLKARIDADAELKARVRRYRADWKDGRVTGLEDWGGQVTEDLWQALDAETKDRAATLDPSWQGEERRALEEFIELRSRDFVGRAELLQRLHELALSDVEPSSVPSPPDEPTAEPTSETEPAGDLSFSYSATTDAQGVATFQPPPPGDEVDVQGQTASPREKAGQSDESESPWGLCLQGPPGSGKSALLGKLQRSLQGERCLLLAHAAGISPRSTSLEGLLRRWSQELGRFLELPNEDPTEGITGFEELKERFRELLSRASTKTRVVCLIDALNQFERSVPVRHITWLPKLWPENVRLIATAIPGEETEALHKRPGVESIDLPALCLDEAEALAMTLGRRHHKSLPPAILEVLKHKQNTDGTPAAGNPLWLTLTLEHLLLLDEDDFAEAERLTGTPEEKLHAYMRQMAEGFPPDIEALYASLFQRAHQRFGKRQGIDWIPDLLDLIAASRHGLRESDLRQILGKAKEFDFALQFANVRRYLRAQLTQRGAEGLWDFTHAQPRLYLQQSQADRNGDKAIHERLADHFEALPKDDPLHESELMVHLIGADNKGRTARYYGSELTEGERSGATKVLAEHILVGERDDPNSGIEWVIGLVEAKGLEGAQRGNLCNCYIFGLNDALKPVARQDTRLQILEPAYRGFVRLARSEPDNAGWQRDLSVSHQKLGEVQQVQGDLITALESYQRALEISERMAVSDPGSADWQRRLVLIHLRLGAVQKAQGDTGAAQASYRRALEISERLAAAVPSNVDWQYDLSLSHSNLGDVQQAQGDLSAARASCQRAWEIAEQVAAMNPGNTTWQRDLSVSHGKLGNVQAAQGDLDAARASYQRALEIRERLAAADPGNVGWQRDVSESHNKLGDVQVAQGDLNAAQASYQRALEIRMRLAAADPGNAGWQRDLVVLNNKLAQLSNQGGKEEKASRYWHECHDVLLRMKRNGMYLDQPLVQLFDQLEAESNTVSFGSTLSEAPPEPASTKRPPPHSAAKANRAAELNKRYQEQLAQWNALPWWKRVKTKRPEPPKGI